MQTLRICVGLSYSLHATLFDDTSDTIITTRRVHNARPCYVTHLTNGCVCVLRTRLPRYRVLVALDLALTFAVDATTEMVERRWLFLLLCILCTQDHTPKTNVIVNVWVAPSVRVFVVTVTTYHLKRTVRPYVNGWHWANKHSWLVDQASARAGSTLRPLTITVTGGSIQRKNSVDTVSGVPLDVGRVSCINK